MKQGHTPEPWTAFEGIDGWNVAHLDADADDEGRSVDCSQPVALVADTEEAEANARLIAASPGLLRLALEFLADQLESGDDCWCAELRRSTSTKCSVCEARAIIEAAVDLPACDACGARVPMQSLASCFAAGGIETAACPRCRQVRR